MRKRKDLTVPASRPRNLVAAALARISSAGTRRRTSLKSPRAKQAKDLDERIRECGEW